CWARYRCRSTACWPAPSGASPAATSCSSGACASLPERSRGDTIMPLSAAVVGTGFIGPVHVEALRRLGRAITGVLGSTPQRGAEAAARLGLRAYASLAELLADPAVGVVHLTSPNRLHFEQCKQVLAAGKHLICEKPLAMTTAETAELVRLARAS